MTSPEWSSLLNLYQQTVGAGVLQYLEQQTGQRHKRGVYSVAVVLWLMMLQRLHGRGTLASAVQMLLEGAAGPLLSPCRRVRRKRISCRTGGYCQARQKLPKLLCKQVSQELVEWLRTVLNKTLPNRRVGQCVCAGWFFAGAGTYPAAGAALSSCTISEQALAEQAMDSLPPRSVVVGDRNFGIFSIAYAAQQRALPVLLRLTEVRAGKLVGSFSQPGEHRVSWKASRWDGGKHGRLPVEATLQGRLIAARVGRGKSKQWLYLFTTLELPTEEILQLYARRWNIETDLRSLKRTVRLHHISAQSQDMMEKELLLAVSAYNLVRAVMCMAARRSRLDPRQLSFTHVLTVVDHAWHKLIAAPTRQQHDKEFVRVLDMAAQCTLPKRPKHRSYPRVLWRRGGSPSFRKVDKTK